MIDDTFSKRFVCKACPEKACVLTVFGENRVIPLPKMCPKVVTMGDGQWEVLLFDLPDKNQTTLF